MAAPPRGFDLPLAPPRVERLNRPDGSFVLRSTEPVARAARCVGEWLEHWATHTPAAMALAERHAPAPDGTRAPGWRRLSWQATRQAVGRIAQSLLDLALPPGDPVVVLSDNAIDHALLLLAGQHVGRPVCSVSSAYSRAGVDHGKLRNIVRTLQPALLYAADAQAHGPALLAVGAEVPVVVLSQGHEALRGALAQVRSFDSLLATAEGPAVMLAFAAIQPEDAAKFLLTSGSTGHPKVVVNTHRMLCANQEMIFQAWPFLAREHAGSAPVLLDWLPWSHTFGANHNFNLVLRHGGTVYIDEGRPLPGGVERTAANLREVQPTLYFNVPRGLDMLLPLLEADDELARAAFGRLQMLFYAGAALPASSWQRLQAVATRVLGRPLWLTTSWGSTETAPAVTSAHWWLDGAGNIGLPLPGMELKFVPAPAGKLELRVRGPAVFPHYRNAPELTAQAFDDEGYYRIGDAGRLADPLRPEAGVLFDGRVAEDFKLGSGTWVAVGTLRLKLLAALSPWGQDAVLTGHDGDTVGALLFPSAAAAGLPADELATKLAAGLTALKTASGGASSGHVTRLRLQAEPPNADAGEITDKGYINQRAVLARRADEVLALHAGTQGNLSCP
jgi:feruloyl-CoA synthase